jgi:hypothetical protein
MSEEHGRSREKREEYLRKTDALCKEIDTHNNSLVRERQGKVKDALYEFNKYARPYVLSDMAGTVYRPDSGTNEKFRQNYDLIKWDRRN